MTTDAVPAGLHVPHPAPPVNAAALELLADLIAAGPDGLHQGDDRQRPARDLFGRHLARPTSRSGGVAVALSWHRTEGERMAAAVPDALDIWAPPWWPAGDLDALALVVAPAIGAGYHPGKNAL